jgi:hypothetical protein
MANGLPGTVMIIRHGEKLGDPETHDDGGKHLSLQGSARAAALPSLFLPSWWQPPKPPPSPPPPIPPKGPILECKFAAGRETFTASYETKYGPIAASRFPAPSAIFATADSEHSSRPVDTISPTASALGLPIHSQFTNSSGDIAKLAGTVLNDFPGAVILICWHHGTIKELATELHATNAPQWHGSVFDRLWLLDYSQGGSVAIQQCGQKLLLNDERKVPATPW